jgi:hypothetical protein
MRFYTLPDQHTTMTPAPTRLRCAASHIPYFITLAIYTLPPLPLGMFIATFYAPTIPVVLNTEASSFSLFDAVGAAPAQERGHLDTSLNSRIFFLS